MDSGKKQKKSGSVIGHDMVIIGDVSFKGHLAVDGEIKGTLVGEYVELAKSGTLDGEINLTELNCSGNARGVVSAQRVELKKSADVSGIIKAGTLEMAAGSVFVGELKISPDRSAQVAQAPSIAPESKAVSGGGQKKNNHAPAGAVNESSALDGLVDALKGGSSLVMVISENSEVRKAFYGDLQTRLQGRYHQFVIEEPTGSFREMLVSVAKGFKVELTDYGNQESIIKDLSTFMTDSGNYLIIMDNVEKMYPATLERMIQYLVGDEHQGAALTKIVLVGGIELQKMMGFEDSKFLTREPDCIFEL